MSLGDKCTAIYAKKWTHFWSTQVCIPICKRQGLLVHSSRSPEPSTALLSSSQLKRRQGQEDWEEAVLPQDGNKCQVVTRGQGAIGKSTLVATQNGSLSLSARIPRGSQISFKASQIHLVIPEGKCSLTDTLRNCYRPSTLPCLHCFFNVPCSLSTEHIRVGPEFLTGELNSVHTFSNGGWGSIPQGPAKERQAQGPADARGARASPCYPKSPPVTSGWS